MLGPHGSTLLVMPNATNLFATARSSLSLAENVRFTATSEHRSNEKLILDNESKLQIYAVETMQIMSTALARPEIMWEEQSPLPSFELTSIVRGQAKSIFWKPSKIGSTWLVVLECPAIIVL